MWEGVQISIEDVISVFRVLYGITGLLCRGGKKPQKTNEGENEARGKKVNHQGHNRCNRRKG